MNFQALLKTAAALTATIAISVWWQWTPITQAERVAGVVKQLQTAACRAAWREVRSYSQFTWGTALGIKPFACMSRRDLVGLTPAIYELDVCKQQAQYMNGPPNSCMSPLLGFKVPAHLKLVYAPTVQQGELDNLRCQAALEALQPGQPWPMKVCRPALNEHAAGILWDEKMSRQAFVGTAFGANQTGLFPGGTLATITPRYPVWCRNPTPAHVVPGWGKIGGGDVFCRALPATERRQYEIIPQSAFQHVPKWPVGPVLPAIPLPAVPNGPVTLPTTTPEALHELLGVPGGKRRTPQQIIQGVHP